jgi:hypothetical protein
MHSESLQRNRKSDFYRLWLLLCKKAIEIKLSSALGFTSSWRRLSKRQKKADPQKKSCLLRG